MAQSDNIPAMLQSGEYVVRKEAVDKLGKDTMDMINNADRLGYMGGGLVPQGEHGHSAIDELLALNTLANQRGVDMTRDSAMMNKGGKVLKKAPEGNKGLMKLPQEVRNRMGYMNEGGKILPGEYISRSDPRHPIHRMTEADMNNIGTVMSIIKDYQDSMGGKQQSLSRSLGFKGDQDYNPEYYERIDYGEATGPKTGKEMLFTRGEDGVLRMQPTVYYGGFSPLKNIFEKIRGEREIEELPSSVKDLIEEMSRSEGMKDGGMMDNYMYGGISKKKKKKGYEDGGSVGVVNEIGKARKMFSDIDDLLATVALMDNYTFGPMQRKTLRSMREADMVDPKDTMEQVMMLLKAREQNKIPSFEKRKSYYQGGSSGFSSPEAGSGSGSQSSTTPVDFLERGFDIYGSRPEDAAILNRVTELFGFDPSVGTGKIQDMIRGYSSEFTGLLPNVQQYGAGFAEFGGREKDIQTARTGAYSEIDRASTDIASSEQDRQMAELIQYLTQLETQGGVKFT
mgnify:CR=1 FL=1|tara:strand:- start:774 stop:2303 length:1530 start_codon:yes stop_codon:yes gene_type:complete